MVTSKQNVKVGREPVIISGVRTPIGSFGGALKDLDVSELGRVAIKETLLKAGVKPTVSQKIKKYRPRVTSQVEKSKVEAKYMEWGDGLQEVVLNEVIMGNVLQGGQGMNTARQASIKAGVPQEVPCFTVNKVCGSGLKSISIACQDIKMGDAEAVVAGGMESMTNTPNALPRARWGYRMDVNGVGEAIDLMVYDGLYEIFYGYHMGVTAENIARQYDITRREQDELGAESHHRSIKAIDAGIFDKEIVPVQVSGEEEPFSVDERPMETSVKKMSNLKPAFQREGTVTAGNASGINDAAAALLITSREFARRHGLTIRAAIRDFASAGIDPQYMGLGPVPAVRKLLDKTGYSIDDIDLIELNEAFASQTLACLQELGLPRYGESGKFNQPGSDKVNPNGSGISLGHPVGCTGSRLVVTLIHELERRKANLGIATLCIGGGQGMAMLIER